jgi:heme exporter protein C
MVKNIFAALLVVLLLCVTAYASFFVAPTESTMGAIQRIFYLHAACGMVALTAFFVCFIGNLAYVFSRAPQWDALGIASAEVGLAFCTVVLLTGPIWAHPVWGVWWAWDARLTLTLVLWLLYLSYVMLRTLIEEPERRALISAVYGIFAFLDVPLVYGSIWWWRTQHPQPVVFGGGSNSGLDPVMRKVFYLSWFSLTCLMAFLIRERYRLERLRGDVNDLLREAEGS